jgi:phage gp37-like protein
VIAAIELAILARLKAMEPTLGFSWRRLETLPDDWEAYLADKAGELRGPAVWVGFTGWRNAELWSDQLVVDGSFGLVVASSSSRPDEQANRHGGPNPATEPGSYRLALGAAAMLADQMLGLDLVEPISVGDADPLKRTARMKELKLSAHAMMLACRFPILLAGDDSDAALAAIHANWDVPAFNQPVPVDRDLVAPGVQLPDDFHADATDHILLSQEPDPS